MRARPGQVQDVGYFRTRLVFGRADHGLQQEGSMGISVGADLGASRLNSKQAPQICQRIIWVVWRHRQGDRIRIFGGR